MGEFGFAEFSFIGIPLVAASVVVIAILGPRLLPDRIGDSVPAHLSDHAVTLTEHFGLGNVAHLRVTPESPLVGERRRGHGPVQPTHQQCRDRADDDPDRGVRRHPFLTPVATPANMTVMGPAGYRFSDFWKLGLRMVLRFFIAAIGLIPLV